MTNKVEHSSLDPTSKAYQDGKALKAQELAGGHPAQKSGEVRKPFGVRMKEAFVGEDAKSTALYFVTQVAAPRLGDAVIDIIDNIFDAMKDSARVALFGEDAASHRGRLANPSNASYVRNVDYSGISKRRGSDTRTTARDRMRSNVHDYRFYEFQSREDAMDVWHALDAKLDVDDCVCVNDFWDAARRSDLMTVIGAEMGWTDLGPEPRIRVGREGYTLDLPRARYLDLRR